MTYPNKHYNQVIVNSLADMPDPVNGIITPKHEVDYSLNRTIFSPYKVKFASSTEFSASYKISATTIGAHAWVYVGTGSAFEAEYPNPGERAWTVEIKNIVLLAPYGTIFNLDGIGLSVLFFNNGAIQNCNSIGTVKGIFYYQNSTAVSGFKQGLQIDGVKYCLIANNAFLNTPNQENCIFISVTGNSGLIQLSNNVIESKSNESFIYIDPTSTVVAGKVDGTLFDPTTGGVFYKSGSKNHSDPYWSFLSNSYQQDSSVGAEIYLSGNVLTTSLGLQFAWSVVNATGYTTENNERISASTDGIIEYTGLETTRIKIDVTIGGRAALASYDYAVRFAVLSHPDLLVAFDNITDTVILNNHGFANGRAISFKKSAGVLPTGLSKNHIYYVANQTTNSFQLSRVIGGAISTFTDNGSGINSLRASKLIGSVIPIVVSNIKTNSISSGATSVINNMDCIVFVVSNQSGSVDFNAIDIYARI